MAYILHIDTSGINCSISVSKDAELISTVEKAEANIHASKITLFIEQAISEAKIEMKDLSAVAVAKGPGSYTGLRIGVSTAKGIAYALDIPLISTETLYSLFKQALASYKNEKAVYIPMIDARRMEVYTQCFDFNGNTLTEVNAIILDEEALSDIIEKFEEVVLFGDGAVKTREIFNRHNTRYLDIQFSSSKYMVDQAYKKLIKNLFENTAYFEPFYLKEFYFKK